ncbi:unnamed protein product [Strongylus vulgaris]|uniref:Sodium/calcium exchanger membrane region domain-containing protein n=1 Tax=Strongylus vulgaris TaxID=40348 RepID=A0A3P7J9Q8_STRVU|nr:unnamed protein product [Strongylus vulgaris]
MLHLFFLLAWCSQTAIAGTTALVPTAFSGGNPDVCQVWKNMTKEGVVWMLMLFVMVSTTADDFFSPNVASIVAHLKISESIAGVTFMAFGNGAPDIFGSIASVLSSPKPKAGLALGELLGW